MVAEIDLLPILQSYVPPVVVRRILPDPSSLKEPTADRFSAAVLFADITNFTSLSERLYESDGAEELADILNHFFDRLITIIHDHGGETTKFAGDALIAIWPTSEEIPRLGSQARIALAKAIESAARCALAIQSGFPEEPVTGLEVSVEIGISEGDVYAIHLGGVLNRWEFLLSGGPLVQMSQAIDRAGPGKIVLSPGAWDAVSDLFEAEILDDGFAEIVIANEFREPEKHSNPDVRSSIIDSLKVYVPAAILARIEAGLADWLSELRRVSVIFIMLPGYGASITHPFRRTLPEAQSVMQALQRALYRYGGSINKLNVDDKGITLVAAFGLPPFSQQDDAARAIHAALEMQSVLNHLGRSSAIGIATGWVYCGSIGNSMRREYTMVGRDVNMATRLMQLAEGNLNSGDLISDIYCDEATFQDIQGQVKNGSDLATKLTFELESNVYVKGLEDPISTYRPGINPSIQLIQRKKTRPQIDRFVGRKQELNYMADMLGQLASSSRSHNGRLIIIEGEAGVGKSLLVNEVRDIAQELSIRTLVGSGNRLDQNSGYHAWKPVFREMYAISEHDDTETRRSKVLAKMPYMPGERGYPALSRNLSPLLNQVLPVDFKETSITRKLSSDERESITHDFILRLMQIEALPHKSESTPLRLLVLEDAQWMDMASWDLAAAVLRVIPSLTMIITLRLLPATIRRRLPKAASSIISSNDAEVVRLGGLTVEEIDELASMVLEVNRLSPDLQQLLEEYTNGHPSLCKELVGHWEENKLIVKSTNQANLRDGSRDSFPIPGEVIKNLTGRFDQLSPTQQMILKISSTVKTAFTAELIEIAYPKTVSSEVISRHLTALERLGFLKSEGIQSGSNLYGFSNKILKDIVYDLLPESYRAQFQSLLVRAR